jgi:hypothetical protein
MKPRDFKSGSERSRAAARRMLDKRHEGVIYRSLISDLDDDQGEPRMHTLDTRRRWQLRACLQSSSRYDQSRSRSHHCGPETPSAMKNSEKDREIPLLPATAGRLNLGGVPLGSATSRAAARRLLKQRESEQNNGLRFQSFHIVTGEPIDFDAMARADHEPN